MVFMMARKASSIGDACEDRQPLKRFPDKSSSNSDIDDAGDDGDDSNDEDDGMPARACSKDSSVPCSLLRFRCSSRRVGRAPRH